MLTVKERGQWYHVYWGKGGEGGEGGEKKLLTGEVGYSIIGRVQGSEAPGP